MSKKEKLERLILSKISTGIDLTHSEGRYLQNLIEAIAKPKVSLYFKGYAYIQDIEQEAYIKLHHIIRSGKFTYCQSKGFGAYINVVVSNLINNERRRYKKLSFTEYLPEEAEEDLEPVYTMEQLKDIAQTILSKKEQEIISMSFEKGLDNEVIAERLGYNNKATLGNVKYRSIQKLRKVLQKSAA